MADFKKGDIVRVIRGKAISLVIGSIHTVEYFGPSKLNNNGCYVYLVGKEEHAYYPDRFELAMAVDETPEIDYMAITKAIIGG